MELDDEQKAEGGWPRRLAVLFCAVCSIAAWVAIGAIYLFLKPVSG